MIEGEHLEIEPVQYYITITVEEYEEFQADRRELAVWRNAHGIEVPPC